MTVNKNDENELITRCNGDHDFNTDCLEDNLNLKPKLLIFFVEYL